jgi:hypothetical protein
MPAAVGEVERLTERAAGGRSAVCSSQCRAELDERSHVLELRR